MRVTSPAVTIKDIWDALTAEYGIAGSYGLLVETNLDEKVSVVDAVADAIKAKTDAYLDHSIADLITRAKGLDAISDYLASPMQATISPIRTAVDPGIGEGVPGQPCKATQPVDSLGRRIYDYLDSKVSLAKADLTTLEARLSAARAANLDNLDVLLSDLQTRTLPEIDDNYQHAAITSSVTSNTYGSWGDFIADVGVGKKLLYILIIQKAELGLGQKAELEIGEGAAGAEVAITRVFTVGTASNEMIVFPIFMALTDNARLALRLKDAESEANTVYVIALIA